MNRNDDDLKRKFIEQKRSQALRLNEPELREFEQKLRNSYILKEQQCQIKEKEYRRLQNEVLQRHEAEIANHQKQKCERIDKERQQQINKSKYEYGCELQLQIDLNRQEKMSQETLKQNNINDAIRTNIEEKNIRKINERIKNLNMHHEMEIFKEVKKVQERKAKLQEKSENEAIERYKKYELQKEQQLIHSLKQKSELKNEIYEIIAAKMLAQQKEAEERQKLIEELQGYEYSMKQKQKYDQDTKLCTSKKQLIDIIKAQIAANLVKENRLHNEELQHRIHLENQLKEYDRHENERKILDKLKIYRYASEIHAQIKLGEQNKQLQMLATTQEEEYLKKMNAQLRSEIEQEKIRISNEYDKKTNI